MFFPRRRRFLTISPDRSGIAAVCRHMSEATIQTKRREREETNDGEEVAISLWPCATKINTWVLVCLCSVAFFLWGGVEG